MKWWVAIPAAVLVGGYVGTISAGDKSEATLRREISARLGGKPDDHFVYSTSRTLLVRGRQAAGIRPKPDVQFHAVQGKSQAIEAIVVFLLDIQPEVAKTESSSPKTEATPTNRERIAKPTSEKENVKRDWRPIGRFANSTKANNERAHRERLYTSALRKDQLARERAAAAAARCLT